MLYICKLSNKLDLNQAIRVSHNMQLYIKYDAAKDLSIPRDSLN